MNTLPTSTKTISLLKKLFQTTNTTTQNIITERLTPVNSQQSLSTQQSMLPSNLVRKSYIREDVTQNEKSFLKILLALRSLETRTREYSLQFDATFFEDCDGYEYSYAVKSFSYILSRKQQETDADKFIEWLRDLTNLKQAYDASVRLDSFIVRESEHSSPTSDCQDVISLAAILCEQVYQHVSGIKGHVVKIDLGQDCTLSDIKGFITLTAYYSPPSGLSSQAHCAAKQASELFDINQMIHRLESVKCDATSTTKSLPSNILIVGRTGSGKSTLINSLVAITCGMKAGLDLDGPMKTTGLGSCTTTVQSCKLSNQLVLWDTPGLADQYGRDVLFKKRIQNAMENNGFLSAIVIMVKELTYIDDMEKQIIKEYLEWIPEKEQNRIIVCGTRLATTRRVPEKMLKLCALRQLGEIGIKLTVDQIFQVCLSETNQDAGNIQLRNLITCLSQLSKMEPYAVGALGRLHKVLKLLKDSKCNGIKGELAKHRLRMMTKDFLTKKIMPFTKYSYTINPGFNRRISLVFRGTSFVHDNIPTPFTSVKAEIRFRLPQTRGRLHDVFTRLMYLRELSVMPMVRMITELTMSNYVALEWVEKRPYINKSGKYPVEMIDLVDLQYGLSLESRKLIRRILGHDDENTAFDPKKDEIEIDEDLEKWKDDEIMSTSSITSSTPWDS